MIYFDNAATGGFKPSAVFLAAENAIKYLNANPGRSSHRLSVLGEEFIFKTRSLLSKNFNNEHIDRVIFTKNCTEALNLAIFGVIKPNSEVVTTATEHNSVLRPLYDLRRKGLIKLKIANPTEGKIHASDVLPLVNENTSLVVVNAVSNVTGAKNDYEEIGSKISCPLLVDAAQAAGHIDIDMKRDNINLLAVAGHKGLYSIAGIGALIFDGSIEVRPLMFGGSGTESFFEIPSCYPELLECGSPNLPSICSLFDGASYAFSNIKQSSNKLLKNTAHIIAELNNMEIKVYSQPNSFGIVSFAMKTSSMELAEILSKNYDIAIRGGFHCAPLIHKYLCTDSDGLARVSLAPQNNEREIQIFLKAIKEINQL